MAEEDANQAAISEEDLLRKGMEFCARLKASLPSRVDPATVSTRAKIPFKALCVREILLYRVSELADAGLTSFRQNQLVAAATITRALLESVAFLYWLYKEVRAAVANGATGKIDEFLGRAMVGTRNESTPLRAHNVMNAIDVVTEDIDHYRDLYEELCEIAHPNWAGGLGAYGELNKEMVWYELGANRLPRLLILGPLVTSLELFITFYERLPPLLKEFASLGERELGEGGPEQ